MKIILSRKGFDSASGGQPNPILPDGTLLSLPIPEKCDKNTYTSLKWNDMSYFDIISSIRPRTSLKPNDMCHLDPDLRKEVCPRMAGWKPAFGQMGAALKHLRNKQVSVGDLFLFFGWYRKTEVKDGKLVYQKMAPDIHVIYGYMQIGQVIEQDSDIPQWLKAHPHVLYKDAWNKNQNAIFLPSDKLSFLPEVNGGGVLSYRKNRVLTKDGMSRRYWNLPSIFKKVKISYHSDPWKNNCFVSAGRGQEFVLDSTPEILDWVKSLIQ